MTRMTLNERFITAIGSEKRRPKTGRADYHDAIIPGLALRVTAKGHRSFVLLARFPRHPKHPTRRAIGTYGKVTLEQARETARAWLTMIGKGLDPKTEEERARAVLLRHQSNTFAAVATEFLDRHVKGPALVELERRAAVLRAGHPAFDEKKALAAVRADPRNHDLVLRSGREGIAKKADAVTTINTEFVPRWSNWPIADIQPDDCAAAIRAIVRRGRPAQAHNALGYLRRLFTWAIGNPEFRVVTSPVERLKPKDLIGKKQIRDRILTDAELRAVWIGAGYMGYPNGPLIQLLILTGQREREVAHMSWAEVDLGAALWTVPAGRMKGDRAHEVPLSDDALALLRALRRFNAGDFVFTTSGGNKPVNGFSKMKDRIDAKSGVADWVFHDLRRTMRTHLSALPVQDNVRELVIAHAQKGLHKVYDLHAYRDEKRECLDLWARRLGTIICPGANPDQRPLIAAPRPPSGQGLRMPVGATSRTHPLR